MSSAFPSTQYPYDADDELHVESSFPDDVIDGLEARGHDIVTGGLFGTANALVVDENGVRVGAETRIETASGLVADLGEHER